MRCSTEPTRRIFPLGPLAVRLVLGMDFPYALSFGGYSLDLIGGWCLGLTENTDRQPQTDTALASYGDTSVHFHVEPIDILLREDCSIDRDDGSHISAASSIASLCACSRVDRLGTKLEVQF